MTMPTQTDAHRASITTAGGAPAWVRADRAAQHAWMHDKAWRKAARTALPPVHRAMGNGGTVGDQLLAQARRDMRRTANGERRTPSSERHTPSAERHAAGCICGPCRQARGEHVPIAGRSALAARRSYQPPGPNAERRTPNAAEAGDQWRLSDEPRALHMSTVDVVFEAAGLSATHAGKMNWCTLRERFMDHLDRQAHHALLSLAEAEPRQARIVICCALLRMRQADVARQEEVTQGRINQLLKEGLAFMRACVVSGDGASVTLASTSATQHCSAD